MPRLRTRAPRLRSAFEEVRYQHPSKIAEDESRGEEASYCPNAPYPGMQRRFYECRDYEKACGGLAGPGKTQVQLQDALQWVGVPGYSCLILRASLADQYMGSDSAIPRFLRWIDGTKAKWNEKTSTATFPGGATVTFGYCSHMRDVLRYKSAAFQKIIFMELTELPNLAPYVYMMSRLRRLEGMEVPLQIQCDFNPDGPCAAEVKARFLPLKGTRERDLLSNYAGLPYDPVLEQSLADAGKPQRTRRVLKWSQPVEVEDPYTGLTKTVARTFVPGYREDNPSQDWGSYGVSLGQTGAVTAAQLGRGDWEASAHGRYFTREMFHSGVFYDELPSGLSTFATGYDTSGSRRGDFNCRASGATWNRTFYLDDWEVFKCDVPITAVCVKAHALWGIPASVVLALFTKLGEDKAALVRELRKIGRQDDRWRLVFMESAQCAHAVWQDLRIDREFAPVSIQRVKLPGASKIEHANVWLYKLMFGEMRIRRAGWNEQFIDFCVRMQDDKKLDAGIDDGLDGVSVLATGLYRTMGDREVEEDVMTEWMRTPAGGRRRVGEDEDDE